MCSIHPYVIYIQTSLSWWCHIFEDYHIPVTLIFEIFCWTIQINQARKAQRIRLVDLQLETSRASASSPFDIQSSRGLDLCSSDAAQAYIPLSNSGVLLCSSDTAHTNIPLSKSGLPLCSSDATQAHIPLCPSDSALPDLPLSNSIQPLCSSDAAQPDIPLSSPGLVLCDAALTSASQLALEQHSHQQVSSLSGKVI